MKHKLLQKLLVSSFLLYYSWILQNMSATDKLQYCRSVAIHAFMHANDQSSFLTFNSGNKFSRYLVGLVFNN